MAKRTGSKNEPAQGIDSDSVEEIGDALRLVELEARLAALRSPGVEAAKFPDVWALDVLNSLRRLREQADADTKEIVQVAVRRHGVGQRTAARAAGLSPNTVNRWVREDEEGA